MAQSKWKHIARIIACIFCMPMLCISAYAESYCSMGDIAISTPARWAETYQTQWRSIPVDVPIEVPKVAQFPIIKVRLMPAVSNEKLASFAGTVRNLAGSLTANRKENDVVPTNSLPRVTYTYGIDEVPQQQPENVTLTYDEAVQLCQQEIEQLWHLQASEMKLETTIVESRIYQFQRKSGQILWGEPITDAGRYKMTFLQLFHGIDVEGGKECYDQLMLPAEKAIHRASCYLSFSDAQNMKIRAALYEELEVVYDDVPLLPFEAAKAAIESEIYAGHLRTVEEMKLCYVPYLDPDDEQVLWLLPAWYVRGLYTRDATMELKIEMDADGQTTFENMSRLEVVFQAQQGTLLNYADSNNDRRVVPEVLRWEDVE